MRQGQQNRRGRGRSSRKGQNPLTRSYESNGPDVKIRGTPAHVAEKYMSLARDAMASGDRVLAENYFQHAEHYNRIIMAFRDQQMGAQDQPNSRNRNGNGDDGSNANDDSMDDDGETANASDAMGNVPGAEPQPAVRGFDEQPAIEGGNGGERERRPRQSRNGGQRRGRNNTRGNGGGQRSVDANGATGESSTKEESGRFADSNDKPAFLKRSVRERTRRSSAPADDGGDSGEAAPPPSPSDD